MVSISSYTKSSTHSCEFNVYFFFLQFETCCKSICNKAWGLNWPINLSFICCHICKTISRLHSVVSKVRSGVSSLKHLCGIFECGLWIPVFTKDVGFSFGGFFHFRSVSFSALKSLWHDSSYFPSSPLLHCH